MYKSGDVHLIIASVPWRMDNLLKILSVAKEAGIEKVTVLLDKHTYDTEIIIREKVKQLNFQTSEVYVNTSEYSGHGYRWFLVAKSRFPIVSILDDDLIPNLDYWKISLEHWNRLKPTQLAYAGVSTDSKYRAIWDKARDNDFELSCCDSSATFIEPHSIAGLFQSQYTNLFPLCFTQHGNDEALLSFWLWKHKGISYCPSGKIPLTITDLLYASSSLHKSINSLYGIEMDYSRYAMVQREYFKREHGWLGCQQLEMSDKQEEVLRQITEKYPANTELKVSDIHLIIASIPRRADDLLKILSVSKLEGIETITVILDGYTNDRSAEIERHLQACNFKEYKLHHANGEFGGNGERWIEAAKSKKKVVSVVDDDLIPNPGYWKIGLRIMEYKDAAAVTYHGGTTTSVWHPHIPKKIMPVVGSGGCAIFIKPCEISGLLDPKYARILPVFFNRHGCDDVIASFLISINSKQRMWYSPYSEYFQVSNQFNKGKAYEGGNDIYIASYIYLIREFGWVEFNCLKYTVRQEKIYLEMKARVDGIHEKQVVEKKSIITNILTTNRPLTPRERKLKRIAATKQAQLVRQQQANKNKNA